MCTMAPGSDAWGLIVSVRNRTRSDVKFWRTFSLTASAFFLAHFGQFHDLQGTRQSAILRPVLHAS